jgi:hypothetical protein
MPVGHRGESAKAGDQTAHGELLITPGSLRYTAAANWEEP